MPEPTVLLCSAWAPWGQARGYQMRLAMMAEALAGLANLHVCILDTQRTGELELPWPPFVLDAEWCAVEPTPGWAGKVMRGAASPVREATIPAEAEAGFRARFLSRPPDLVWCEEARGFEPVAPLVDGPIVLDLHNVHSALAAHKRRALAGRPWDRELWDVGTGAAYFPGLERRWRAWEQRAAARSDVVVVCSDRDRRRIDTPNTVTVPNCYPRPERAAGVASRPSGPLTMGFVGAFDYQPNADGLRWFVQSILPRVRAEEPGARILVIGRVGPGIMPLGGRPGVELAGFVDDLTAALERVDVLVAPLRFGGGTRFKILEGFAHALPVVSTTVGAEGIDATDGVHLLVGDEPRAFADAVLRVYRDRPLRQRLVASAMRLYDERYTWERGVAAVRAIAGPLIDRPARRERASS